MATYTVSAGQRACHAKTLTANIADTVSFTGDARNAGYRSVEVANHPGSAGIIYAVADGTAATVAGSNTVVIFPGQAVVLDGGVRGPGSVSLISAAAATYSVTEQ